MPLRDHRDRAPLRDNKDKAPPRDNKNRVPLRGNENKVPMGEIQTIAGGFAGGDMTTSSQKAYARQARYEEIYLTDRVPR